MKLPRGPATVLGFALSRGTGHGAVLTIYDGWIVRVCFVKKAALPVREARLFIFAFRRNWNMSAQKKKTLIIVCAAVVLVAAMLAVWFAFGPKGTAGQKAIGVTVVYADATTDEFSFSTDAEFLRQALEEQKLVEGEESQYGLYVKTVNGVTADEAKEEWWCFTKDGEDVMTGVDSTPVADGDHFEITLKTGY